MSSTVHDAGLKRPGGRHAVNRPLENVNDVNPYPQNPSKLGVDILYGTTSKVLNERNKLASHEELPSSAKNESRQRFHRNSQHSKYRG